MNIKAEKIDKNQVALEVEIAVEDVTKAINRAYHQVANYVNIPGFRKGKIPKKILDVRVGKKVILDEAFEIMAPQAYGQALVEAKLIPVSKPELEVVQLEENKPCIFKATVTTKPEVVLGQYKGIQIAKEQPEVTEQQVEENLETLRNRHATMVVVDDRPVQMGDMVIIDFEGTVDGEAFEGGTARSYMLELGSGTFIPGFEEQLVGCKVNDEKVVAVTFPADYHAETLAGKAAEFKVTIKDAKEKQLPELNDEFAKEVSEFTTLEELKADVKNKLEESAKQKAERDFKNAVIKDIVDNAEVDVPSVMVDNWVTNKIKEMEYSLEQRGLKLDQYLTYAKTDINGLKEKYRPAGETEVKTDLVLEAIAKAENLTVSDEDTDSEIAKMAAVYQAKPDDVKTILANEGRLDAFKQSLLLQKTADFLVDLTTEK